MRIVKVKPTYGETGFRDRGLCRGLSWMRGNSHVQFLGEETAVTPFPYPTKLATTMPSAARAVLRPPQNDTSLRSHRPMATTNDSTPCRSPYILSMPAMEQQT